MSKYLRLKIVSYIIRPINTHEKQHFEFRILLHLINTFQM